MKLFGLSWIGLVLFSFSILSCEERHSSAPPLVRVYEILDAQGVTQRKLTLNFDESSFKLKSNDSYGEANGSFEVLPSGPFKKFTVNAVAGSTLSSGNVFYALEVADVALYHQLPGEANYRTAYRRGDCNGLRKSPVALTTNLVRATSASPNADLFSPLGQAYSALTVTPPDSSSQIALSETRKTLLEKSVASDVLTALNQPFSFNDCQDGFVKNLSGVSGLSLLAVSGAGLLINYPGNNGGSFGYWQRMAIEPSITAANVRSIHYRGLILAPGTEQAVSLDFPSSGDAMVKAIDIATGADAPSQAIDFQNVHLDGVDHEVIRGQAKPDSSLLGSAAGITTKFVGSVLQDGGMTAIFIAAVKQGNDPNVLAKSYNVVLVSK